MLERLVARVRRGDDAESFSKLGENYAGLQKGSVRRDYAQAARCWGRAAALGHGLAALHLAHLTEEGFGIRADGAKALRLLKQAAMGVTRDIAHHVTLHTTFRTDLQVLPRNITSGSPHNTP